MFQPRHFSLLVAAVAILAGLSHAGRAQEILGKPLNTWVAQLDSPESQKRRDTVFRLGREGKEAVGAVPKLVQTLKEDKDAAVRDAAAWALGEIGATDSKEAIQVLKNALTSDSDPKVRRSAAYALGRYAGANFEGKPDLEKQVFQDREALHKALNDPEAIVRQNAAWALGQLGQQAQEETVRESVRRLIAHLSDAEPDSLVRRDAANALGEISRPDAEPAAGELLKTYKQDKDRAVRRTALTALVNVVPRNDKKIAEDLQAILSKMQNDAKRKVDVDKEELYGVALALANIGGEEATPAIPVLCQVLRDEDKTAREQAAAGLGSIGMPAAMQSPT